jgi:hypothetical protein
MGCFAAVGDAAGFPRQHAARCHVQQRGGAPRAGRGSDFQHLAATQRHEAVDERQACVQRLDPGALQQSRSSLVGQQPAPPSLLRVLLFLFLLLRLLLLLMIVLLHTVTAVHIHVVPGGSSNHSGGQRRGVQKLAARRRRLLYNQPKV